MKRRGVYLLTNTLNGHSYVGSSNDIHRRWSQHRTVRNNTHIANAIAKYGYECFEKQILEEVPDKSISIISIEQHWLDKTKADGGAQYNICLLVVNNRTGIAHSETTKKKIGSASRGRKHSPESRRRMSETSMGRIISNDTKRKMSNSQMGHIVTEAVRDKIRVGHIGKAVSEATRKKMSIAHIGHTHTDATRQKMTDSWDLRRKKI